jgi:hypothetical protein
VTCILITEIKKKMQSKAKQGSVEIQQAVGGQCQECQIKEHKRTTFNFLLFGFCC